MSPRQTETYEKITAHQKKYPESSIKESADATGTQVSAYYAALKGMGSPASKSNPKWKPGRKSPGRKPKTTHQIIVAAEPKSAGSPLGNKMLFLAGTPDQIRTFLGGSL